LILPGALSLICMLPGMNKKILGASLIAMFEMSIFFAIPVFAEAPICKSVLASRGNSIVKNGNLGIFSNSKTHRNLAYRYLIGTQKSTVLLIHGLGDDMTKLNALADKYAKDGFSVLRVDLHGHGETLKDYLKLHDQKLPDEIDYSQNIQDIKELIHFLGLSEIEIIGHSYGGGIAYGLTVELEKEQNKKGSTSKVRVNSITMMAPYVQRIDKFLQSYFQSPEFVLNATSSSLQKSGVPKVLVQSMLNPFYSLAWYYTVNMHFVGDAVQRMMMIEKAQDLLFDPYVEKFMTNSYREYFILSTKKKESELSAEELALIDLKVSAAIKVTKGIRGFDLLDQSKEFPIVKAPLLIMGGSNDKLVMPEQLDAFGRRLKDYGKPFKLIFLEGENSGHLFPRFMADQVYDTILDAWTSP
jgi:pimeloyl-ACP methyl ester carboxylesterase